MKKNYKWKIGDIYAIDLGENSYGFLMLRNFPIADFYDIKSQNRYDFDDFINKKLLFRIWITLNSLKDIAFNKIGHQDVDDLEPMTTYVKDSINGKYFLKLNVFSKLVEVPESEAKKHEKHSVYSAKHAIERFKLNLDGKKYYDQ